jgi:hypothetical protein
VVAVRRRLAALHRAAAPPSIRVLEGLFGILDNRVLALLVELDIPELLDQPKTAADLATAAGTEIDGLERFLRYAVGRGFLKLDRRGRYAANAVTAVLRRDHPNSWRGWVDFLGSDWFRQAADATGAALAGHRSGVEAAFGESFFGYVNITNPGAGDAFNRAMEAGATLQALALTRGLDWSATTTVCDVGGGTGAAVEFLLDALPSLSATLFDLPQVVRHARSRLTDGDLEPRCRIVGGSFFEGVPDGCDRYLLLAIVHDWSDDEAVAILKVVRAAMGPDSRAVVVESLLPERPRGEFVEASDVLMRILASGRERTDGAYKRLFSRAGLTLECRSALATGFSAFVLTR